MARKKTKNKTPALEGQQDMDPMQQQQPGASGGGQTQQAAIVHQMQQLQLNQGPQMPVPPQQIPGARQPRPRGLLQFSPAQATPPKQPGPGMQVLFSPLSDPRAQSFQPFQAGPRVRVPFTSLSIPRAQILQSQLASTGVPSPFPSLAGLRAPIPRPLQAGPRVQTPIPSQISSRAPAPQQQPQKVNAAQATLPTQQPQQQQTGPGKAQATQQQQQQKIPAGQQQNVVPANRRGAQAGAMRPPPRPGAGTLGRPINLSANHFALTVKSTTVYHYDVEIKPEVPKALFKKILLQFIENEARLRYAVFDLKKNIYTARPIPGLNAKIEVPYKFVEADRENPRDNSYKIIMQPTGEVEVDVTALASYCRNGTSIDPPLRPIQALDIALKYGAAQRPNKVMLGSCLLTKPSGRAENLGGGVEVYFGHFQSLRLGWQPFLNVDATQRAFMMSGKVHFILAEALQMRGSGPDLPPNFFDNLRDNDYRDFGKKIATLKVTYSRGAYVANVGCNGLKGPASREKFECDGKMVTVQQYFETKLKIKLKFPHLPCVWVGSREKNNLVPMELCSIAAGQEYRRKLTDIQTSNMIKVAATPADVRKRKIIQAVQDMNFAADSYAQHFGISVDTKMAQVKGRVLPAPKLVYGQNETSSVVPRDGVWNMRNLKFIDAKVMTHFGLINITRTDDRAINTFIGALTAAGREMGMNMGNLLFIRPSSMNALEADMRMAKQRFPQLQILFVIINRKGDPAYEIVKRVGDLDLKLTTQCIQFKNVLGRNGPDPSTMSNICLKLNAKLGGINNLISREVRPQMLLKEQVILMGADVTHPGADQQDSGRPSIAAVVGSVDPRGSQYCCEIRVQKSKQEYIEDMEGMVYNLLRKFNRVNGAVSTGKPQRIIFYRDGVSEGQFAKVLEWELSAIRKACNRLENGYEPPVTFVVVQKRHHTRLFPDNPQDECGRGKNVPPGTVVDSTIVHPVENDFFLVSHQGIQGTSRPTHYHVLWDDSKLSADDMQKMTYYLCYLFNRCTRSVSYPAPCYYSHLVAFRGRIYYDGLMQMNSRVTSLELQRHIDSTRDLSFMFFC